jgi:hypothetical protein
MKTRARECFHTLFSSCNNGEPGETRARVVYMASQMNRDVTRDTHIIPEFLLE